MSSRDLPVDQKRALLYLEILPRLLSYGSPEEVFADVLAALVNMLDALGGSVCYVSTLSANIRQGELEGPLLEQIDRWEQTLRDRLHRRTRDMQLPSSSPVATHAFPEQNVVLLSIPLIYRDRIHGSVTLAMPTIRQLDHREEQTLSSFVGAVCAVANDVEELTATRHRLSQLGLFYQMGQAMTSTFDLDQLFGEMATLAVAVVDAQAVILRLYDQEQQELVCELTRGGTIPPLGQRIAPGQGIAGWAARSLQPVLLNDVARDDRFDPQIDAVQERPTTGLLCVPLQIKGRLIGVLEALNKKPSALFDQEDMGILITLAAQTSIALDNARLYNTLRADRDRIIEAQERTRRELGRKLHDGPVQMLAALEMRLDYLARVIVSRPEAIQEELGSLRTLTQQAMQEARMLLFEMRPLILETQGLVPALQSYVERLGAGDPFVPHFDPGNLRRELDPRVAGIIFSIVQEAVTNIQKHAEAQNVWIRLEEREDELIVSVEDDGRGFDVRSVMADYDKGASFGLLNMRERAELIDGVLQMESGPVRERAGTLIRLRVTLPHQEGPNHDRTREGQSGQ